MSRQADEISELRILLYRCLEAGRVWSGFFMLPCKHGLLRRPLNYFTPGKQPCNTATISKIRTSTYPGLQDQYQHYQGMATPQYAMYIPQSNQPLSPYLGATWSGAISRLPCPCHVTGGIALYNRQIHAEHIVIRGQI